MKTILIGHGPRRVFSSCPDESKFRPTAKGKLQRSRSPFVALSTTLAAASLLLLPIVRAAPANASGNCGIYGTANSSGLTVSRVTGNCDQVGAQVRYSGDGVTFYWSTPGFGYYQGISYFDTSRYYADQTWGWSGSGWSTV